MSLSSIIRAVTGGPGGKLRAEGDKPEKEDETEATTEDKETSAETEDEKDPDAETDEKDPEAEGEDDDTKASGFVKGRRAERKRIGAILGSPHADANPGLAAHLAFRTAQPAADAIAALKSASTTASGRGGLNERMSRTNNPQVGPGATAPAGSREATVASIKNAVLAIGGRNKKGA